VSLAIDRTDALDRKVARFANTCCECPSMSASWRRLSVVASLTALADTLHVATGWMVIDEFCAIRPHLFQPSLRG
jgi:hypothetical protein